MIGRTIAHYEIVEKLGEGGMGVVYKARDPRLNRYVALKILPPEHVADARKKQRFIHEAKAASALNHPGIITIHDISNEDGVDFIVMEFVDGATLDQLKKQALPIEKTVRYAIEIADALGVAHKAGIIHRDLKPENIMVTSSRRIKILDFGMAKLIEVLDGSFQRQVTQITDPGSLLGTVEYMSPEQAEGRKVDHRSDIFSFGLVLYEMLTRKRAFQKGTSMSTIAAILYSDPPSVRQLVSDVPPELEAVVQKCLQKSPDARFQDMEQVKKALEKIEGRKRISRGDEVLHPIAVLPFANLSSDRDNEYFSEGLTEEIITALTNVPGLRVTARTSAFALRGKVDDVREIGKMLKVDTILEGSVRRSSNRLRITAQLVNTADGYQIWSERYDRTIEDIFKVQDEITAAIVEALKTKLAGMAARPAGDSSASYIRGRTMNLNAHESYLKGRFHWNRRTWESLRRGIDYFDEAVAKDPQFPLSYVGLADSYNLLGYYNERPPSEAFPKAKEAAAKALEIDDRLAEAHASLAYSTLLYDWNWKAADREFRRALELNANYASAHEWHAWYYFAVNRLDNAAAAMRRAHQLDPLSPSITTYLALSLSYIGKNEEAVEHLRNMIEMNPNFALAYLALGTVHWHANWMDAALEEFQKAADLSEGRFGLGRLGHACAVLGLTEQAQAALRRLEDRMSTATASPLEVALIYAALNEPDEVFSWLDRAFQERISDLIRLRLHPWPKSIRSDPRFEDLTGRIGLP